MLTDRLIDDVLDDEFAGLRRGSGRPRPVDVSTGPAEHTTDEPVAKGRNRHKDSADRDRPADHGSRHNQGVNRFNPRPIIVNSPQREAGAVLSAMASTCVSTTGPAGGSTTSTNQAPDIANPGNQTNNEGDSASLELSASDPNCDSLTFSASGLPTGLSIDSATGLISGTLGYSSAGSHSVTVSVSDGSLSDSETFDWTVNDMTCKQVTSINASPGTTIYADESVTLTAVLGTTGNVDPDSYVWTENSQLGTGQSITLRGPVGTHNISVEAKCTAIGTSSTASIAITVNPVVVSSITISPSVIYVGSPVTFTANFTPAGHSVDSLTWELFFVSVGYWSGGPSSSGGSTTTATLEATSEENPSWTYTPSRSTHDESTLNTAVTREYKIKVTAVSGGSTSTTDATFEVTPYTVTGIVDISVNGGGYNEGELFKYVATVSPAGTNGAEAAGNTYAWTRRRTSNWGSGSTEWLPFGGDGKEATHTEKDPGVWEIKVELDSGGHRTSATGTVTIQPALITNFRQVGVRWENCELIFDYKWDSTSGRLEDLDWGTIGEALIYYKNDGTAPSPFSSDAPFDKQVESNPYVRSKGPDSAMTGQEDDVHHRMAIRTLTTGFLDIDQYYWAVYGDAPDSTNPQILRGPMRIHREIFVDQLLVGYWYKITKPDGGEGICSQPPPP